MDVKLNILNSMLAAIGSSGISSTIGRHPGLIKATPILERNNRTIQAVGHWFNTEWNLKLLPNLDNEFILPQNTLKADTTDKSLPYVRRGRQMYDPRNHSFIIDVPYIHLDVVVQLDYNDLPIVAEDLITAKSKLEIIQDSDADAISLQSADRDYKRAMMAFQTERLSQADFSIRDNPNYARIMGGINARHRTSTQPRNLGG